MNPKIVIAALSRALLTAVLVLAFALNIWVKGPSAAIAAPVCRTTPDHEVCILSIKRSAKYHWQYRAAVSLDGIKRPVERYNCRRRVRIRRDGKTVPFQNNGAGDVICQLLE